MNITYRIKIIVPQSTAITPWSILDHYLFGEIEYSGEKDYQGIAKRGCGGWGNCRNTQAFSS